MLVAQRLANPRENGDDVLTPIAALAERAIPGIVRAAQQRGVAVKYGARCQRRRRVP
jgi:hypothetical protein